MNICTSACLFRCLSLEKTWSHKNTRTTCLIWMRILAFCRYLPQPSRSDLFFWSFYDSRHHSVLHNSTFESSCGLLPKVWEPGCHGPHNDFTLKSSQPFAGGCSFICLIVSRQFIIFWTHVAFAFRKFSIPETSGHIWIWKPLFWEVWAHVFFQACVTAWKWEGTKKRSNSESSVCFISHFLHKRTKVLVTSDLTVNTQGSWATVLFLPQKCTSHQKKLKDRGAGQSDCTKQHCRRHWTACQKFFGMFLKEASAEERRHGMKWLVILIFASLRSTGSRAQGKEYVSRKQ